MLKITAKEYREKYNGQLAYLDTSFAVYEIKGISEDYWAIAPAANGGRGLSFSLHAQSEILMKKNPKDIHSKPYVVSKFQRDINR